MSLVELCHVRHAYFLCCCNAADCTTQFNAGENYPFKLNWLLCAEVGLLILLHCGRWEWTIIFLCRGEELHFLLSNAAVDVARSE